MESTQQKPKVKQFKDDLKEKELKAFNELKAKVVEQCKKMKLDEDQVKFDRYTEDNQCVRLLWAREFKVEKAFEMWKKWVDWRIDFKADEIKEEDVASELQSGKAFWHGMDKQGNPCLVVKVKYHRPGVSSQDVVLRYFLYLLEEGISKCEQAGTGKVSVIWDREGFDKKNFDSNLFSTFKKLNQIMQDNYAERLSTIYILHPNWFFKTIYAVVKPFLTSRTKSKITIVDKTEELKKFFEPSELLIEHGGTSDYKFVYPFPKPISDEKAQEQNANQQQQNNLIVKQVEKQEQEEKPLKPENVNIECDEDLTEEDYRKVEDEISENTNQTSSEYDISQLSHNMFNKVLTMKSK
ncbi:divergent CRAL/TRIO domain protein (macronuclear) [Tetrahymena thermophila SB210]|uniref:Divergent CRAL/TRIO domain protein n=1 Tax=Tetrahymena thermophila (strain SB210) TaxID=312017 RepID=Q238Z1_TETTS|nr:divergent CRAL/TRIO domain protein [Tetrahymena thermophila SB210]EAR93079.1 divergent CRAL/TRIO domain protein [Tetrahymena thermophila SB210]|eukprot:XP_001013324.1 divergent CRAL/TRIO domain protein [Tetrahymena thermophila SB210]